jgi:hypothetical protein
VIGRRTIFSLLLALMILLGLRAWLIDHQTLCDHYLAGARKLPSSVYVQQGNSLVEVPCTDWLQRQPVGVDIVCLLDLAVFVVFLLSLLQDLLLRRESRQEVER